MDKGNLISECRMPPFLVVVANPFSDYFAQFFHGLRILKEGAVLGLEPAEERFHLRIVARPIQGIRDPSPIRTKKLIQPAVTCEGRIAVVVDNQSFQWVSE